MVVVAACRLASAFLLGWAVPARHLLLATGHAWGGWLRYLASTRVLGLVMFAYTFRLPVKWLAWVHLIATLEAARLVMSVSCQAPALCNAAAQQSLQRLAAAATSLRFWAPLSLPAVLQQEAPRHLMLQCPCMGGAQLCLCQQVTLWLLVCFGYALPLLLQYIEQEVTLRAFLRRRCRHWPRCPHCLQQLTPDMETLIGTSCLLFLGFCAASWQLIQAWAVADRLAHGREL
ncbi:hypothetical protein D9Q98_008945 [Chlorella vulgaris]|uniref:Uncharacterized protein n=1 Tax=Chlorella vulgaris TaxID=3077 RepID=A0A9D4TGX3_CHLVU|nr:hypothetical protein D9Q98_008945 [Chlorella vulgaris]